MAGIAGYTNNVGPEETTGETIVVTDINIEAEVTIVAPIVEINCNC